MTIENAFDCDHDATDARPEFHICDERSANWLLRKLANIAAEKRRITAQAEEMQRQLDADAARLMHVFGSELEEFTRQQLAEAGNRRKSLTLLQGTCAFRHVPAGVKVADKDAALLHAQASSMESLLRTTVELNVVEYKRAALERLQDGEDLLPGMETTPERETFFVRFGKTE